MSRADLKLVQQPPQMPLYGPALLGLPADVLRQHILLAASGGLDRCSQLICRRVCRRLAALLPPRQLLDDPLPALAARSGYLPILQLLQKEGRWSREQVHWLLQSAAYGGHVR